MVQLKQITRNATFAWSPAKGAPLIASGTIAGAVDASFSQDSELEIWDLDLDNTDTSAFELTPTAKITTERKFYSLAWGYVSSEKPRGVIAGAMDDGHLNIWDANAILSNSESSLITSNQTHRGAIKVVEFNPVNPKLLMSAGSGGEFNIWDLENPAQPYPAPTRASRVDDIEAASWNRKVANILATASTNGFTSVWDLRQSREILHLQNPGRRRVSTLAWDPDNPTRIITGCGDDTAPALYVWDLRNSNAPAQTLEGHSAGVLSVSWCHLDHDLLLSCGKDNRTILWNPQIPKVLGEFPIASTWAFETQWCPQNPDILANATFEGKIAVHRLQSTLSKSEVNGGQPGGGEDFFSQRQYVSEGGFELKQAPKWLQVPCSASFGFGGSLVSVKNIKGKGDVKINKYISEPKISENASEFEEAIRTADWMAFCEKQIEKASTDSEKGNWELLRILFNEEPKKELIEYLGVKDVEVDGLAQKIGDVKPEESEPEVKLEKADSEVTAIEAAPKNNRLSRIFGSEKDDFLSQLTTTPEIRSYENFSITSSTDSESDKLITQAILFGHFDQAVDICLKEDRLSDAFVLATLGDKSIQKKVQDAYFSRNSHRASYLRLLQNVIESNLWDVAEHADLSGWKQILVSFCTFAKSDDDFSGLCELLGQRLEKENKVKDAKVCYMAGKKLDRMVNIWIAEAEIQEKEQLKTAQNDSAFSIHARALQGFVEKVTVFKQTKGATSGDLKPLYDKYTEFVEIVASQGNLTVAQKYIDLLPGENEAVKSVKNRLSIAMATRQAPATSTKTVPNMTTPGRRGVQPISPTFPANQYTPAQPNLASSSQWHPGTQPPAPAPPSALPPKRPSQYVPAPATTPQYTPAPTTSYNQYAPPSQFNQYTPGLQPTNPILSRVADLPPPPPKKTGENWNDPPMLPNPIRARTPIAPMVKPPSPFTGTSPVPSPSMAKPPSGPPPASAKPPQRVKSPPVTQTGNTAQFPPRQVSLSQSPPAPAPPPSSGPPSRPPQSTFTPPPPRNAQPPPRSSSAANARPQYAPSPMQQQNSFPPPGQPSSQYAPPPGRNQYVPAASPVEAPSAPPVKPTPPPAKFPPGDRSHIPATSKPIYDIFSNEMNRIKSLAQAPQQKRIVADADKRLNILFDLLNNDDVIPANIITQLVNLAHALAQRNFDTASQIQLDLHTTNEQFSAWMVGIKRLIDMSRAFA